MTSEETKKEKEPLKYPIYALLNTQKNQFYIAGGGGNTKSGIKNVISQFQVSPDLKLEYLTELILPQDQGAVMNMTYILKDEKLFLVCGVDEFSRVYEMKDSESKKSELKFIFDFQTDFKEKKNPYDDSYQKLVLYKEGVLFTAGTDQKGRCWQWNNEKSEKLLELEHFEEPVDASFCNENQLAVLTPKRIYFWDLDFLFPKNEEEKIKEIKQENDNQIKSEKIPVPEGKSFRFIRFGKEQFYTVEMDTKRNAYISQWSTETKKVIRNRLIHKKQITAFAISHNGQYLAYGTSDGSIGLVDSLTLKRKWLKREIHTSSVTGVSFDEHDLFFISVSPDHQVLCWDLKKLRGWQEDLIIWLSLLVAILAYLYLKNYISQ